MTQHLKRLKDNIIVKTKIKEIKSNNIEFKNWLFDWIL